MAPVDDADACADGETYAVAQGNLVVGGLGVAGNDGSSVTVTPDRRAHTAWCIDQKMVDTPFQSTDNVLLIFTSRFQHSNARR